MTMGEERDQDTRGGAEMADVEEKFTQQLAKVQLLESQLSSVAARVSQVPTRAQELIYLGQDPQRYVQSLAERHAGLVQAVREERTALQAMRERFAMPVTQDQSTMNAVSDLLHLWMYQRVPVWKIGIIDPPDHPNASGELYTVGLTRRGAYWWGSAENDTLLGPTPEAWWVHTWSNSITLPPAPYDCNLSVRFMLDSFTHILLHNNQPLGMLRQYSNVFISRDTNSSNSGWGIEGWPIDFTLPTAERAFNGRVRINGNIAVKKGDTPIVNLYIGVVVGLERGTVYFSECYHETYLETFFQDPKSYEHILYRYDPPWWEKAVMDVTEQVMSGES